MTWSASITSKYGGQSPHCKGLRRNGVKLWISDLVVGLPFDSDSIVRYRPKRPHTHSPAGISGAPSASRGSRAPRETIGIDGSCASAFVERSRVLGQVAGARCAILSPPT